jgi:hypothetical protein
MSGLIPAGKALTALARKINAAHQAAETTLQAGLEHARTAGLLLIEAKEKCDHGQWLPWLKANVRFSDRTAQNYIRIAKRWDELVAANPQALADLTYEDSVKLLALPEDDDEEVPDAISVATPIATPQRLMQQVAATPVCVTTSTPAEPQDATVIFPRVTIPPEKTEVVSVGYRSAGLDQARGIAVRFTDDERRLLIKELAQQLTDHERERLMKELALQLNGHERGRLRLWVISEMPVEEDGPRKRKGKK